VRGEERRAASEEVEQRLRDGERRQHEDVEGIRPTTASHGQRC
jgi:hypothetical protein